MRIHTDTLDTMPAPPDEDVLLYVLGTFGSRTHTRAFEVALRGHGTRHKYAPQAPLPDSSGGERAATCGDWGRWLALVFDTDPAANAGPYTGRDDFHAKTNGAYCAK